MMLKDLRDGDVVSVHSTLHFSYDAIIRYLSPCRAVLQALNHEGHVVIIMRKSEWYYAHGTTRTPQESDRVRFTKLSEADAMAAIARSVTGEA